MRTPGIFKTYVYEIPFKRYGVPHLIVPLGDIHYDDYTHFDRKAWKITKDYIRKQKRVHIIGMGDYNDFSSTTERRILKDPDLHCPQQLRLEMVARNSAEEMCEELKSMNANIIGLIEGNHYFPLSGGITSTQYMCNYLTTSEHRTAYLGTGAIVVLLFRHSATHCHRVDLFMHHGKGGGTPGNSMNKVVNMMQTVEADIYLMGDNHQKQHTCPSRLRVTTNRGRALLKRRQIICARTGSYQLGYVDGKPSHVVDNCLTPVDTGSLAIEMTPVREAGTSERPEDRYVRFRVLDI